MKKLTGKIALVTGAGKGIGRAIALELADMGASVIVNYNGSVEAAETTVEDIRSKGVESEAVKCDVSDCVAVKKMVDDAVKKYGQLDILVNNAGITKDGLMMAMTEEQFDDVIAINLKGCFNCMKAVTRTMLKQRSGHIINISSVSGVSGNAGQINYAASKAGIIGMTKTAAKELGSRGITVNAVAPGFIRTDMTSVLSDNVKESILGATALKRLGEPEDIAHIVGFLSSDDANYITGQVIGVDGGMV